LNKINLTLFTVQVEGKGKGKVHSITGYEGPEVE